MPGDIKFSSAQAVRYGLVEAIILRSLASWLEERAADENCFVRGDNTWLSLTVAQIHAELPFLSPYRIRTAIDNLTCEKLILTDETDVKFGLRKRKLVSYALSERGYELTHLVAVTTKGTGPLDEVSTIGPVPLVTAGGVAQ